MDPAIDLKHEDVTDLKQAEEVLRLSEEKYRGLFENVQESVAIYRMVYDQHGKAIDRIFVDVNPKALSQMGDLTREDVIGKSYSEVVSRQFPQDKKNIDKHLQSLAAVAQSGIPVTYDTHFGGKYYLTTQYLLNKDLVASSSIEITERKKAEEALHESEGRYRELVENANSIIIKMDTAGKISFFNARRRGRRLPHPRPRVGARAGRFLGKVPETAPWIRSGARRRGSPTAPSSSASIPPSTAASPASTTTNRHLNLRWYLDVRARWADGSPAEGALVSVSDRTGREAAREELRAGGRLGGLVLREASIGLKEAFNFTPHEVNCSFGSVYNRTVQHMDRSRFLDIVLEDRDAPIIDITYPGPDQFLGRPRSSLERMLQRSRD